MQNHALFKILQSGNTCYNALRKATHHSTIRCGALKNILNLS